jgi:4-hydroxy-tetrahydrodipicolinate synthase
MIITTNDGSALSGSIPALVTPFSGDSWSRDELEALVEWHIDEGSAALVVCGTTGESPTLSELEQIDIIAAAVFCADGRLPIIAGAGSNATATAIELTRAAEEVGADATLHVAGYYNRPTSQQLVSHFHAVADAARKPILLYDIPHRAAVSFTPEEVIAIAAHERIVGVKDSTGDLRRLTAERIALPDGFAFFSGDDFSAMGYLAAGGSGWVSVVANVVPGLCAELVAAVAANDLVEARRINDLIHPLAHALTLEPNPSGPKYALSLLDRCSPVVRGPLTEASSEARARIRSALSVITG